MIDLTPIINAIIAVLGALALRYVVPWVMERTTAAKRENLLKWVEIAVAAAQQLYYQSDGQKRLEHALGILEGKGFDVNDEAVLSAVEAAVLKLHQGLGESA